MRLPVTFLDVFAEAPLQGTFHVVVHDADGLSATTMAVLARRLRLSETSFVQSPTADGADYRHRIFTVATELPFAGHPSVGTAAAVAQRSELPAATFVQQTGAGLQRLDVDIASDGRSARVDLAQNAPQHLGDPAAAPLLEAIGCDLDDAHPDLGAEVISTGLPTLVLPVRDAGVLSRLVPDIGAIATAMSVADGGPVTCYVVTPLDVSATRWRARCFTDQVAGGEDPATGSAAGPLTAYAHWHCVAPEITVEQAVEIGAHSRITGRIGEDTVIVSGHVQFAGTGTFELPAGNGAP